jgi:hypothetical protein
MAATYASVAEVRSFTKVQAVEYSDAAITILIENAQAYIDEVAHTTFGGSTAVTEYREVEDKRNWFFTNYYPIISITSLKVDDDDDGTYTEIGSSDFDWWTSGLIKLNDDADISYFPSYNKCIEIKYNYGYASVPELIRFMTLVHVALQIQDSVELQRQMSDLVQRVKAIYVTN